MISFGWGEAIMIITLLTADGAWRFEFAEIKLGTSKEEYRRL